MDTDTGIEGYFVLVLPRFNTVSFYQASQGLIHARQAGSQLYTCTDRQTGRQAGICKTVSHTDFYSRFFAVVFYPFSHPVLPSVYLYPRLSSTAHPPQRSRLAVLTHTLFSPSLHTLLSFMILPQLPLSLPLGHLGFSLFHSFTLSDTQCGTEAGHLF